jgi:hypothetical protein
VVKVEQQFMVTVTGVWQIADDFHIDWQVAGNGLWLSRHEGRGKHGHDQ